jgi:hypothetical protein
MDTTTPAATTQDATPSLAEQMALHGFAAANPDQNPANDNNSNPVVATDQQPATAGTLVAQATPDYFTPFKEKFGYNTAEDAFKEIEELRQFKAQPTQAPSYEFENEESKKLFEAWVGGKKDEVLNYLTNDARISSTLAKEVTPDTAEDLVKLAMGLEYKNLSADEINYRFKKQFGIPSKPARGADEEQEDYDKRVEAWAEIKADKQMELMIEAKMAKPKIEGAKQNFKLPEIEQQVDEAYIQYRKDLENDQKLAAETAEAYKLFTPESIKTQVDFKNDANKVAFSFQYQPDAESFSKSVGMVDDINKFWGNYINQDGTPDRKKFLEDIHFASNRVSIISEAIKQAVNATIKAMLPDNSGAGLVRTLPNMQEPEMSDVDKQMAAHGIKRGA